MTHYAATPEQAIAKLKRFHAIEHDNNSALTGGTYYVQINPTFHPLRRYTACYIKGAGEEVTRQNCEEVNGVLIFKNKS